MLGSEEVEAVLDVDLEPKHMFLETLAFALR